MEQCNICPRNCKVNREQQAGYCGMTSQLKAARAALHFWEEPCFSGNRGSGTVFFSGCALHCVFCQNKDIANGRAGKELTVERLAEIFLELQEQKAHNINLVTAGHFAPWVACALELAKNKGLTLPILYNSSGYESVESLKQLQGLIDIYLPDFKYWKQETANRYSNAPDYPLVAKAAIAEMVRQVGPAMFVTEEQTNGLDAEYQQAEDSLDIMKKGVLVRHLILPEHLEESKAIIQYLYETYGDTIYLSIMNQYTPMPGMKEGGYPELSRKITSKEYDEVVDYAIDLGVENAFIQEGETAKESFIPAFDGYGI